MPLQWILAGASMRMAAWILPSAVGMAMVNTDFFGDNDIGYAVTVQTDGKIIVAGNATTRYLFCPGVLQRGWQHGNTSSQRNRKSNHRLNDAYDNDYGRALALQTDGKILVAGFSLYDIACVLQRGWQPVPGLRWW